MSRFSRPHFAIHVRIFIRMCSATNIHGFYMPPPRPDAPLLSFSILQTPALLPVSPLPDSRPLHAYSSACQSPSLRILICSTVVPFTYPRLPAKCPLFRLFLRHLSAMQRTSHLHAGIATIASKLTTFARFCPSAPLPSLFLHPAARQNVRTSLQNLRFIKFDFFHLLYGIVYANFEIATRYISSSVLMRTYKIG